MKREPPPIAIPVGVDQLLLERGEFSPVEWLLQQDRLSYRDYQAWRQGEEPSLEPLLFGDLGEIRRQLMLAAPYLVALGYGAQLRPYRSWHDDGELICSDDDDWNRLWALHHSRQTRQQADLFLDTAQDTLAQSVRSALVAHQWREANARLADLRESYPVHIALTDLTALCRVAPRLTTPITDFDEERDLLNLLQATLQRQFSDGGRDLLLPFVRRLAQGLAQHQPRHPELSALWEMAQDWSAAYSATHAQPQYAGDPQLRLQAARQAWHGRDQGLYLAELCSLCWNLPDHAAAALDTWFDAPIADAWQRYRRYSGCEQSIWFPAWLALEHSGLAEVQSNIDTPGASALNVVNRLSQRQTLDGDTLALRAELRALCPPLFDCLMRQP